MSESNKNKLSKQASQLDYCLRSKVQPKQPPQRIARVSLEERGFRWSLESNGVFDMGGGHSQRKCCNLGSNDQYIRTGSAGCGY